jgi:hypothetical protein
LLQHGLPAADFLAVLIPSAPVQNQFHHVETARHVSALVRRPGNGETSHLRFSKFGQYRIGYRPVSTPGGLFLKTTVSGCEFSAVKDLKNETKSSYGRCISATKGGSPMWFEIWVVTIALAIGLVVTAQIIERQGDATGS